MTCSRRYQLLCSCYWDEFKTLFLVIFTSDQSATGIIWQNDLCG
jgi:hypothetical protein